MDYGLWIWDMGCVIRAMGMVRGYTGNWELETGIFYESYGGTAMVTVGI